MSEQNILISVQQKYLARILVGEKKVELRRRALRVPVGTRIWIYSKAPHAVVAAVATVEMVVSMPPRKLWEKYGGLTGVTRDEFDSYFSDASTAWAIFLKDVIALSAVVTLATLRKRSLFHPPQFFKRLQDGSSTLRLLRSNFLRNPT